MNSFCKTCNHPFLKLSTRDQCYDCLIVPPTPQKKERTKKITRKGQPRQLFPYCIILQDPYPDRHVLASVCSVCERLPVNDTARCSKGHLKFLKRVMSKDSHNEIGFKVEHHYLTFPFQKQDKVEVLLDILRINFRVIHVTDHMRTQSLEEQMARLQIHPGVDLDQSIQDDPHSSIASQTYLNSDVSNSDADKLAQFSRVLTSKNIVLPSQTFNLKNGQLFVTINWPGKGIIMVNVSLCKSGNAIYKELKFMLLQN